MRQFQNKITLLLLAISFFSSAFFLLPTPQEKSSLGLPDSGSAHLLRALSGPFHTLLADRVWLLSSTFSESASATAKHQESETFFHTMRTIAILDPAYLSSLRYGSTYLASIYRNVDQAHDVLDDALIYLPELSDLHLLKISLEMAYQSPPRYPYIQRWTSQIEAIEGSVPEWLGAASLYAREREIKRTLHQEDLDWLESTASSDAEKAAIAARRSSLTTPSG